MGEIVSEIRREIIDNLILVGCCAGHKGTARELANRILPSTTMLDEIERHMDRWSDWTYDKLFYDTLDILAISDEDFISLCEAYMNPIFNRKEWDADEGEWIDLNPRCLAVINEALAKVNYEMVEVRKVQDKAIYKIVKRIKGPSEEIKNIIFAADKVKPDIVVEDALSNSIKVLNESDALVYTEGITKDGISWLKLIEWYKKFESTDTEIKLIERLDASLDVGVEKIFFKGYLSFVTKYGKEVPALIPQVYLYYDPKTEYQRGKKVFDHQRMDFMLIISPSQRVVIELDGVQHYGTRGCKENGYQKYCADKIIYAEMMKAHRDMMLKGYDVYRFGGRELWVATGVSDDAVIDTIKDFFVRLCTKHGVLK